MGATEKAPAQGAILLFAAFHGEGHTAPLLNIASYMVQCGHKVVFLGGANYCQAITDIGAEYFELAGSPFKAIASRAADLANLRGLDRAALQIATVFFTTLPERAESLCKTLETLRERHPTRQIIIVQDILNMARLPWAYGRPLPKGFTTFPKSIGISTHPMLIRSIATAPLFLGLPPDDTESGRLRNEALHRLCDAGPFETLHEARTEALQRSKCTETAKGCPFTASYTCHDAAMMLCSPSLEYDLPDKPAKIHFAGCLPPRGFDGGFSFPSWWSDVITNSRDATSRKKLIFICQGTVSRNWALLVEPAIEAFAGKDDFLVVASLGVRGSNLDPGIMIPSNVRVLDYLPYDAILPHADVFISNGGYGAFSHAVMNGVPMVLAGETEEKPEVIMRAVYAGFGYSLKTQSPTAEMVKDGVEVVLADPRYKRRAVELQEENTAMEAMERIRDKILEFTE